MIHPLSLRAFCFKRRGLTLVELLAVIAIIGMLVGMLLPAVQAARESARRSDCASRLRQVGLALHQYQSSMGRLPAAGVSVNPAATQMIERDGDATPANRMAWAGASWAVFILPFLEQKTLNDAYDHSRLAVSGANNAITKTRVPALVCPAHPFVKPGSSLLTQPLDMYFSPRGDYSPPLPSAAGFIGFEKGNYAVNVGANKMQLVSDSTSAAFKGPFSVAAMYGAPPAAVSDGSSNVIVASEIVNVLTGGNGDQRGAWGWPGGSTFCGRGTGTTIILTPNTLAQVDWMAYSNNDMTNPIFSFRGGGDSSAGGGTAARSFHSGGCNFVFADGAQRFLTDAIDPTTYVRLLAIADGNVVSAF
jgi:prepilin-type N-terminal cleavage/methylation domain-containing protein/prepilin-type processing-associated H-X9-DG protein